MHVSPVQQIIQDLGAIRCADGKGINLIDGQVNSMLLRIFEAGGIQKVGTFSVLDPGVVEEAKRLVAATGGLWIVVNDLQFELYAFVRK